MHVFIIMSKLEREPLNINLKFPLLTTDTTFRDNYYSEHIHGNVTTSTTFSDNTVNIYIVLLECNIDLELG